jgi:hypothetical protein
VGTESERKVQEESTHDGHIVEIDEEVGSALLETILNHAAHQFSLCNELGSVEASLMGGEVRFVREKKEEKEMAGSRTTTPLSTSFTMDGRTR